MRSRGVFVATLAGSTPQPVSPENGSAGSRPYSAHDRGSSLHILPRFRARVLARPAGVMGGEAGVLVEA